MVTKEQLDAYIKRATRKENLLFRMTIMITKGG